VTGLALVLPPFFLLVFFILVPAAEAVLDTLRVERGEYNIDPVHLADAIEALVLRSRASLSDDRSPKDPYQGQGRK